MTQTKMVKQPNNAQNTREEEKMKILITSMYKNRIKLEGGARNINIIETYKIAEILRKLGHEVIIGSVVDTDVSIGYDKLKANSFDKVLIMNSKINAPEGKENRYKLVKFLQEYDKTLYYMLVDLALPFEQLKYNNEDLNLKNDMVILSQAFNLDVVKQLHAKSEANIKDIRYVPFERWILDAETFMKNTRKVDLIMGTSFREGRREKKQLEYFFGRKLISTELFGSIKKEDFTNPNNLKAPIFSPKLKDASKVLEKNATGFATIIFGDDNYNNNIVTLRLYESILANAITFIDEAFDSKHLIYPNEKFLYVNNGRELESKIIYLKDNELEYRRLINVQHKKVEEMRKNNFPKLLLDSLA